MTLTADKPIDLIAIQNEFSVASLGAAGTAYLGRTNCNMLEFLGASANTYSFFPWGTNYIDATDYQGGGQSSSAGIQFYANGTVFVGGNRPNGSTPEEGTYTWQTRGSAAGVTGYVTRLTKYEFDNFTGPGSSNSSIGNMVEPTLNTWIPINEIGWSASAISGEDYLRYGTTGSAGGTWKLTLKDAKGRVIVSDVDIYLRAESQAPGIHGGSFFY
jgi:hypothetical protein